MTAAYEGVELPLFSRHVAVTHRDGDPSEPEPTRTFTGVLRRFTGVLGIRIAVRDWPAPALSHLALDRFVGPTHWEPLHPPSAAARDASQTPPPGVPTETTRVETAAADRPVPTDDVPERASDAPAELRVRDVIRPGPDQPAAPAPETDTDPPEAPGRRGSYEIGVLVDHAPARKTVPVEETVRPTTEQTPPTDRAAVARARSGSRRPADQSGDTLPPIRTAVLRHRKTGLSPGVDSRGGTTGPGETPTRDSGESSTETAARAPETDDRPGVSVTHPTVSRSDDPRGGIPTPPLPIGRPHILDRRGVTVSRTSTAVFSRGRDRSESTPELPRSSPRGRRDADDSGEPPIERSRPITPRPRQRRDAITGDWRVRLEPLRGSAQAAQAVAQTPAEPPTATTDFGTRPSHAEQRDGPPLTVRRDRGSRRGDAGDRRDDAGDHRGDTDGRRSDDLPDGPVGPSAVNESSASRPPRRSADQFDGQLPDRIDELLDVDVLVDRLVRAFERAARIERERRGR